MSAIEFSAPTGDRHEHVRVAGVRPCSRQRMLRAGVIEEEDSVLAPRLAHYDKHELASTPRVERMRHPDGSLPSVGIRCG
jgi:hypothetical protein